MTNAWHSYCWTNGMETLLALVLVLAHGAVAWSWLAAASASAAPAWSIRTGRVYGALRPYWR